MKKVIIIFMATIITVVVIVAVFLFVKSRITFKYTEEPFDIDLTYYGNNLQHSFLSQLGYKVRRKTFEYKKERYKIIFAQRIVDKDSVEKWREWISEKKQAIVYLESNNNKYDILLDGFEDFSFTFQTVSHEEVVITKSDNKVLRDVKELHLSPSKYFTKRYLEKISDKILPLVSINEKVFVAIEKHNKGSIIYLSDSSIFSNKSLLQSDNAIFLNNLLVDHFEDTIIYDSYFERKKEKRSKNKGEPPFWLIGPFKFITLQLIILTFVFFLTFFKRFGPLLDKSQFKKRSLLNHMQAVGFFFEKTNNKNLIIEILDDYFIDQLQRHIKIVCSKDKMLIEFKKRYKLTIEEEDLFTFKDNANILQMHIRRLKFIKKLKQG